MSETSTPPSPATWERDPVAYELTWTWRDTPPTEPPMLAHVRALNVQLAIRQLARDLANEAGHNVNHAIIVLDAVRV